MAIKRPNLLKSTRSHGVLGLLLLGVVALPSAAIIADPPAAAAPPYASFSVTASKSLRFTFTRSAGGAANTDITFIAPAGTTFKVKKDGVDCPEGDATACGGSDVSTGITLAGVANIQIINISEPVGSPTFEVVGRAPAAGNWATSAAPTNATIQVVQASPNIVLATPANVPSGFPDVLLDASGSSTVYRPTASAPALTSITWATGLGNPVTLTPAGTGKATFDAPVVVAPQDLLFQVDTDDGTFRDTVGVTVTVKPPARPVDAVLLMDVSGSMGWHSTGSAIDLGGGCCSRLASAKVAAKYFVDLLGAFDPNSRAGVALFPGQPAPSAVLARQFIPATGSLAPHSDFPSFAAAIGAETVPICGDCSTIPASPGTPTGIPLNWNGTPTRPGLDTARRMLMGAPGAPGSTSRMVVLLSDGAWNSGGDPAEVAYLNGLKVDSIRVFTVGVGSGTDNVQPASLQAISVGTGVGTALSPLGFTSYNIDDPANPMILTQFFEKVLSQMTTLNFSVDPLRNIARGQVDSHPVFISRGDSVASFTVAWQSSSRNLLQLEVHSPDGRVFRPQPSSNGGYSNILLGKRALSPPGKWSVVVRYPSITRSTTVIPAAGQTSSVAYTYSALMKSSLAMELRRDRDQYFTGDSMVLEARLTDANRRLAGATVVVMPKVPKIGGGEWHLANKVSLSQIVEIPDTVSGEPLTPVQKKNRLLQSRKVAPPGNTEAGTDTLRDDGISPDREAGDGIYTGKLPGLQDIGVHTFLVVATGKTSDSLDYRRETELQQFVDIKADPGKTWIQATKLDRDGWAVLVVPMDAWGKRLGPGFGGGIRVTVGGQEPEGGLVDSLDGSYHGVFRASGSDPIVVVDVRGSEVYEGPASGKPGQGGGGGSCQGLECLHVPQWGWILMILLILLILLILVLRLRKK